MGKLLPLSHRFSFFSSDRQAKREEAARSLSSFDNVFPRQSCRSASQPASRPECQSCARLHALPAELP